MIANMAKLKPTTPAEIVGKAEFLVNRMNGRLDRNLKTGWNVINLLKKVPSDSAFGDETLAIAKQLKEKVTGILNTPKFVDSANAQLNSINNYIDAVTTEKTNRIMAIAMQTTYSGPTNDFESAH